jgi:hypothetical protein
MREIPLVEIPMSVRLDNILRKGGGYKTLNQIDEEALERIKKLRGCGKLTYNELERILLAYRLDDQYRLENNIIHEDKTKQEFHFDSEWEKVIKCGKRVERLYLEFVNSCDQLADSMFHDEDYVLGQLFPKKLLDRRDTKRIRKWVLGRKDITFDWLRERWEKRQKNSVRHALIASLGLTKEQLDILQEGGK